ncbi:MAG: nucleotide pyrophosphohydrolase [Fimbriimonadaceae bacterium]|nr:nucleotide pyrophosphohydrolase [Fimbriimonadaceae bacterium]
METANSLEVLTRRISEFVEARDWSKFHNPKDLAISLSLEANEVLELMQWKNGDELLIHLESENVELGKELSDVLYWTLLLAHSQGIDLATAFELKMQENEEKYPVSLSKGSSKKYDQL